MMRTRLLGALARSPIAKLNRHFLSRWGYELCKKTRVHSIASECTSEAENVIEDCRPYTMTSTAGMWSTWIAAQYVRRAGLAGDIVECGVWQGGSAMIMARSILAAASTEQLPNLLLFDTFTGMTKPTEADLDPEGGSPMQTWERKRRREHNGFSYAPLEMVKHNVGKTSYPTDKVRFIKGPVEETLRIPENLPERIALLRLDTDWYESTAIEMEVLYPRLIKGGVLIIDDYGHWRGSRKAVDEYVEKNSLSLLLQPVDEGARITIKP
jgi:O-methyltransferase